VSELNDNESNAPSLSDRSIVSPGNGHVSEPALIRTKPPFEDWRLNFVYEHTSDLGNSSWFTESRGRSEFRYLKPARTWLEWDSKRWKKDERGAALQAAKNAILDLRLRAAYHTDNAVWKRMADHAMASEKEQRLRSMLALSEPDLSVPITVLDADPCLLNIANGTIDLRTGALRRHSQSDHLTRLANVAFDAEAVAPRWESFLDEIFGGDSDLIRFIQRAIGYCLTGETREQVFFVLYGRGANGKSTFVETLRALLGDYSTQSAPETFLSKRTDGIPNDLAALTGVRLVAASETQHGRRLAESLVKSVTGGDSISARFLHGEWFEYRPQFKLWLSTNYLPAISGTDAGIWRRVRLIPFNVTIAPERQDQRLGARLKAELPGILAWAVRGCLEWQSGGLGNAQAVQTATAAYRVDMDAIGRFLQEHCADDPTAETTKAALYNGYLTWSESVGERPVRKVEFGREMVERGYADAKRTAGKRVWIGISLLQPSEVA
jgi:putative DNA primase/helicase